MRYRIQQTNFGRIFMQNTSHHSKSLMRMKIAKLIIIAILS